MAGRRMERKPRLALHQLTFRRGTVWNARFTPDSNSVIYGAAWEGRPVEMFEGRVDSVDGRALDLSGADVLAISSTGEMTVMLHRQRGLRHRPSPMSPLRRILAEPRHPSYAPQVR